MDDLGEEFLLVLVPADSVTCLWHVTRLECTSIELERTCSLILTIRFLRPLITGWTRWSAFAFFKVYFRHLDVLKYIKADYLNSTANRHGNTSEVRYLNERFEDLMHCLLLVDFFRGSVTSFLSFVLGVVDTSANSFTHGVAGVLGFFLVSLGWRATDHFLEWREPSLVAGLCS